MKNTATDMEKDSRGQGREEDSLSPTNAPVEQTSEWAKLEKSDGASNDRAEADSDARSSLSEENSSHRSSASSLSRGHHAARPSPYALSRANSEVRDGIAIQRDPELDPERDPELGPPLSAKKSTTAPNPSDPNLVTWTGPDDPDNPKNWPFSRKWSAVFVVSTFTLIAPVSSTMVAPALTTIGKDLGITEALFVLAFAIGPLLWGPLSELYGRVVIIQLANLIYLFFNLGCGFARTKGQLIAFRFLSGLGGSAPQAIGGGVLSDLFTAEQRGKAISVYSLCPLLGPAIGPIAGAFIAENTTWRWAFWATTIADALIQVSGLFFLRETYVPVLLHWKRKRLVKETGNTALHTPFDDHNRTLTSTLSTAMMRPFRLLATQVIVQCLALYLMYLYGLLYIVLTSFPTLFASAPPTGYGEPLGISGLNYISLGIGFFLGAQICAPLQDRIYAAMKRRYGAPGRPEYRTPMMFPAAVLVPVGLLIYGWTAEYKTHWIGPNIGASLIGLGSIVGFQCLQGYLVDAYARYAASAVGAATVLRSLAGFGFPLFAPALYSPVSSPGGGGLGYGWGNSLLALVGALVGLPGPLLLWRYGEVLRRRSPFAAGG
ncbi:major facilitator superfamily domain-containing protein [Xylariaceae sp. FL0804]|nr:major facilitator superfamily domain-containing protein [Xylariaceae sp. FL0804]